MPIERELKLRVPAYCTAKQIWSALDAKPRRRRVDTTYFDTDSGELRKARAALRLRRSARRWLQCLKVDPRGGEGLLARHEWELPARGGRLDLSAFPVSEIRDVSGVDLAVLRDRLIPVFHTRFVRAFSHVTLPDGTQLEVCFDQGTIEAGGRRAPLREIEFEILQGDALGLLQWVRTLIPDLGLTLAIDW